MPHKMTKSDNDMTLSAQDVIDFLKQNPNFLQKHPQVCDLLDIPRQHTERGVADFQQYMVRRLREDRDGIIEEAREIVETSRANMSNLARVQTAVLLLLESQSFEDFIHTLTMDCASVLDVDIIALVVETDGAIVPHINLNGVRAVTPGTIELVMKNHDIMLESDMRGIEEIYGGGAGLVKSQALAKLTIARGAPHALLAFGSRDPALFRNGQATDLIMFFGRVVERCFRSWLDLPRR